MAPRTGLVSHSGRCGQAKTAREEPRAEVRNEHVRGADQARAVGAWPAL